MDDTYYETIVFIVEYNNPIYSPNDNNYKHNETHLLTLWFNITEKTNKHEKIEMYYKILHKYTCLKQLLLGFSDIALLVNIIVCGYNLNTSFN